MSEIAQRITDIIDALGLKKAQFAERLNISNAFASELCSGRKAPSNRTLQDICSKFGVNEIWLRTGEGEMFEAITEDEAVAAFFAEALRCEGSIKNKLVHVLAKLDENEWAALESIAAKMLSEEWRGQDDE